MKKSILTSAILVSILSVSCKKSYTCVCVAENPSTGLYTNQVSSTTIKSKNKTAAQATCAEGNNASIGCSVK